MGKYRPNQTAKREAKRQEREKNALVAELVGACESIMRKARNDRSIGGEHLGFKKTNAYRVAEMAGRERVKRVSERESGAALEYRDYVPALYRPGAVSKAGPCLVSVVDADGNVVPNRSIRPLK